MVFLIQNTQNRDTKAINIKLDEIIRVLKNTNTRVLDLDELTDEQLSKLEESFKKLAHQDRKER
jgi:low affinity Fe/Cu permease